MVTEVVKNGPSGSERAFTALAVGPLARMLLAGMLLLVAVTDVHAVELNPELRLPPLDGGGSDITRRPEQQRSITARTRPRPELEPLGVRIGSLQLTTELGMRAGYNDNLFAAEDRKESDFLYTFAPRFELRSDWSRHEIRVGADAVQARHQDFSGEDYDDWRIFADTRLDVGTQGALFGQFSVSRGHETRESPNSIADREMAEYLVSQATAGWSQAMGRFEIRLAGGVADHDFEDRGVLNDSFLLDDNRDRVAVTGEGRLRYAIMPGYGVFVRGAYNRQKYDDLGPGGTTRDSSGIAYDLGLDLEITDLIFGDAFVGYYRQRYEDSNFEDRDGLGLGANLYWNPTTLSTLHLRARRSVEETILPTASGYIATEIALELQHELLRNLLVLAGTSVTNRDYQGLSFQEDLWQYHLAANYMLNRNLSLRWRLGYRDQQGDGGGRSYTQTFVEQHLVFRF